jgi:type II secretory pathway pseudopilin PulG
MVPMASMVARVKMGISTAGNNHPKQGGFTFVLVLVAMVIMGITAQVATYSSAMERRRAVEEQLLFVGNAYREAIKGYYYSRVPNQYPMSIDDLLYDPRFLYKRHLRLAYTDPATGGEWELLIARGGGIIGVVSRSEETPIKQEGFYSPYEHFAAAKKYHEWQFRFTPAVNQSGIR